MMVKLYGGLMIMSKKAATIVICASAILSIIISQFIEIETITEYLLITVPMFILIILGIIYEEKLEIIIEVIIDELREEYTCWKQNKR